VLNTVPDFRPRGPWLTADLQTMRNFIVRPSRDFAGAAAERVAFDMADGTGDYLLGERHAAFPVWDKPFIVVVHGLTGCADSHYVVALTRHLLDNDYSVLRLNLRGCGPSLGHCQEQYHAGRSDDLLRVLRQLAPAWRLHGVVVIGFSLGGGILLKMLGELGPDAPVRAAVAISAPIDLAEAVACLGKPRNLIYARHLLRCIKDEALASRNGLAPEMAAALDAAGTLAEFDAVHTAPRYGFGSAVAYYAACSARAYLAEIRVPTLVIHAHDDPWIPFNSYAAIDWRANPFLLPVFPERGGHVGFHAADSEVAWHERLIVRFLSRI
jgi:hypothetical protein